MPELVSPVVGVAELLTHAAQHCGGKVALVELGGRSRTWGDLDAEVTQIAHGLSGAGLVAGYRVMIAVGNRIEFVTTYLAALRLQVVAVPVNPRSTQVEFAAMLADSGARLVVADADTVDPLRAALAEQTNPPRLVVIDTPARDEEIDYAALRAERTDPLPALRDPERLAVLLYTSGTSGRPRGAMLSHRALAANLAQIAQIEPPLVAKDDTVLGVLPLFHVYGLNAVLGGVIKQHAKLVLMDKYEAGQALGLIEDEAVTVVPVAPPVFGQWLQHDHLADAMGPVRLVLSGSAPLDDAVVARFRELTGVPVHQGYGLTEAAPVVTSTLCHTPSGETPEVGSVGAALPGIEIRLLDDDGREATDQDPGEILIRGANLFSGYWPDGADGPDADGWWATGDVGFLNPDGELFLVDRIKDLIIVSGFNVYPSEIEDLIGQVAGVAAVAVVSAEDPQTGQAVVAYVVPQEGATELASRVSAECARTLARFKRPARIEVVSELPRTVTGKVQKGRLRAQERRRQLSLLGED